MKASKFSDAQKAFTLKRGMAGVPVAETRRRVCRVPEAQRSTQHHHQTRRRDPGRAGNSPQGDQRGSRAIRLSPRACSAATGGLDGQHEADLSGTRAAAPE